MSSSEGSSDRQKFKAPFFIPNKSKYLGFSSLCPKQFPCFSFLFSITWSAKTFLKANECDLCFTLANLCLACRAQIMGRMQTNQSKQAVNACVPWLGQTSGLQPKSALPRGKQDPGQRASERGRNLRSTAHTGGIERDSDCLVSYKMKCHFCAARVAAYCHALPSLWFPQ